MDRQQPRRPVSKLDPEDQSEADKVPVGSGPGDVTWSDGALWVTNETEGTLSKIDAASSEVVDTVDIYASPAVTAVTVEGLWVAVQDDGANHRGGTLTIIGYEPDSIDPGVAYGPVSWEILNVTNDGLVGFKRTGGVEGATLVPNLATSSRLRPTVDERTRFKFAPTSATPRERALRRQTSEAP